MDEWTNPSDSYIVLEKMIRLREIMFSELQHLMDVLEGQGLITPAERSSLLELASGIYTRGKD